MTRILLISPMWPNERSPSFGVFVKNSSEELRRNGFDVDTTAVIAGQSRSAREKISAHLRLTARIAVASLRPADCIYLHAPSWFSSLAQITALAKQIPVIVHLHGSEVFPTSRIERLSQPLVAAAVRRARLVIVPSQFYAREVIQRFDIEGSRIFISPSGGVDTSLFVPVGSDVRSSVRTELGIPADCDVIGYFGRIDKEKGCHTFLDALAKLTSQFPRLRGLVIGDGRDREAFMRQAERLGVIERLHIFGFQPQPTLARAFCAIDVLLFPTWRDSLGLVPIEAMACGTPVVGSDTSAVPEYVRDGESGFLACPRSADDFAEKAARILSSSESDRELMRRHGRRIAEEFDARRIAEQLASAISKAIREG